jgi:ketosteroid isomerase-like protein
MERNLEIVIAHFEHTNARDFAAVMDAFAEDVVLAVHGVELGAADPERPKTLTGKAAVGDWFGDWFTQFGPDYRFEIAETRSAGDHVLVDATHHGHGRASRAPVAQRGINVYTIAADRISRVELWLDRDAAVAAFERQATAREP